VALTSIMPADTTGFGSAGAGLVYDPMFTLRVLPTIQEASSDPVTYTTPDLLIWDDAIRDQQPELWVASLGQLGLRLGLEYDLVTRPGFGVNMAQRISGAQLGSYHDLFYLTGTNLRLVHSDAEHLLLDTWFSLGDRDLLAMGLDVAMTVTAGFALDRMGVGFRSADLGSYIENQDLPVVFPIADNPVFQGPDRQWLENGRCETPGTRFVRSARPNAVTPIPTALRLAEFSDPAGAPGIYPYAAALLNTVPADGGRTITIVSTLRRIMTDQMSANPGAPLSARVQVLSDILTYFGQMPGPGTPTSVPGSLVFEVAAHPNPFNPTTNISYTMPQAGHLVLKVFDVRGHLVRTLLDERREAGVGRVVWDGSDNRGAPVPSGVYFYEARSGREVRVRKMTMVK